MDGGWGFPSAWQTGETSVEAFIRAAGLPAPIAGRRRPVYEPERWNERPLGANCYGYARNEKAWLTPGRLLTQPFPDTVSRLFNRAVADGMIPAPADNPPDIEGYYLTALFHGVGWHWYRKDANGLWSHKDGESPVSNRDFAGALITDPKAAALGACPDFVGYFYMPCPPQ